MRFFIMAGERFLGIDFSGGAAPWRPTCARPAVWVATLVDERLTDLRPAQALGGEGGPFARLVALLRAGDFRAAAIDAPLALPLSHMPAGGHKALLQAVAQLPPALDRPFPRGEDLIRLAAGIAPLPAGKLYRETERSCGAPARSTLWNGARPGAPFTMASLTLLARAECPAWPWSNATGMMVEAFPMAQLKRWGLRHAGYGRPDQRDERSGMVKSLAARVSIAPAFQRMMTDSPDALDAVVAIFAGVAAATGRLAHPLPAPWRLEGAIAVHD